MYQKLSFKAVKELAAPHTWPASWLPVALGGALSCNLYGKFSPVVFLLTLAAAIFLQSAVNCINDYFDFVHGTDTAENSLDPADASIVYNNINPRCALYTGIAFIVAALILGVILVALSGPFLLILGGVGVLTVIFYSAGPRPISSLPFGEMTSGLAMGALLTWAACYAQSLRLTPMVLYFALPQVITIALIMLTNNTCDIERDRATGRHTLAVRLGRKNARLLYLASLSLAVLFVAHVAFWNFRSSFFIIPIMLLHLSAPFGQAFRQPFTLESRLGAMVGTLKLHTMLGCYYVLIVLADAALRILV